MNTAIANAARLAIATETQSFDEPAFQANLARMLEPLASPRRSG